MNESGLCKCGCGGKTGLSRQNSTKYGHVKGHHVDFIKGHVTSKGGRAKHSKGYVLIRKSGHPRTDNRGYVLEHLLVMEEKLGRPLVGKECVHHKDGKPGNNNPDNLQLCRDNAEHKQIHQKERAFAACGDENKKLCSLCGKYDDPANLYMNPANNTGRHRACAKKRYNDNIEHMNELQRIRRHKKNAKTTVDDNC